MFFPIFFKQISALRRLIKNSFKQAYILMNADDIFLLKKTKNNMPNLRWPRDLTSKILKYLGVWLNDDLSNPSKKRRYFAFFFSNRCIQSGFNFSELSPKLKGNLLKACVRPVLSYGLETLSLKKLEIEIKSLART